MTLCYITVLHHVIILWITIFLDAMLFYLLYGIRLCYLLFTVHYSIFKKICLENIVAYKATLYCNILFCKILL